MTAIATSPAPTGLLTEELFWNGTIDREVLLDGALPTHAFATSQVSITRHGALETPTGPVRGGCFSSATVRRLFRATPLITSDSELPTVETERGRRTEDARDREIPGRRLAAGGYLAFWPGPVRRLHGIVASPCPSHPIFRPTGDVRPTRGGRSPCTSPGRSRSASRALTSGRRCSTAKRRSCRTSGSSSARERRCALRGTFRAKCNGSRETPSIATRLPIGDATWMPSPSTDRRSAAPRARAGGFRTRRHAGTAPSCAFAGHSSGSTSSRS